MKKLLLSLLACGSIAAANAQAGSILAFGDLGIHATKDSAKNPTKTLGFNINPGVGYQFNKNWTAGIYVGYEVESSKPDNGKRSSYNIFRGGLFGRYTCQISEIFNVFGQVQAGYYGGKARFDGESINNSGTSGFEATLFPAVAVNIKNGFALNFGFGGLGFKTAKHEGSDYSYSQLDFNFGQQFNIGISKNFGGRHHAKKGRHGMMDDTRRVDASDDEDDAPKSKKKATRDDDDE